jgi:uncharacterized protein (DUF2147 family)
MRGGRRRAGLGNEYGGNDVRQDQPGRGGHTRAGRGGARRSHRGQLEDQDRTAAIAGCASAFCITLKTGEYAGKSIGKMSPTGDGGYEGSITKPSNGKTYSGSATLSGNSLKLKGCVFGGLICESQNWSRL